MLNLILLQDQAAGSGWSSIIMIVLLIAIFYFFMIRPQSQKQKKINEFRKSLKKGSKVMTASGVYGRIVDINDETGEVKLEIARDTVVRIDINFVYESAESATEATAVEAKN